VHSPEGGALEGVTVMVFPNLRRMHENWNCPLRKQLSFYFLSFFHFIKKKYFHGNMAVGSSPSITP
jgi:hypothetical protein